MKKFLSKCLWFSVPLVLLFYTKPIYLLINDRYQNIVAGKEIYLAIKKSKQKTKYKKIIIGDSVADQLFPSSKGNDSVNSLATNQAIGLVGQFILLYNYLQSGNKVDSVFLVYAPFSFMNNLDQVYTYHYFLKPFYTKSNKQFFTERVYQQIHKIPYYYLCHEPYIQTSNWAPEFICHDSITYNFLSPVSIEYLNKIKILSARYHFQFILIPTPTRISNKPEIELLHKSEVLKTLLVKEFDAYLNNITYLEDSCFIDNVHLKNPQIYQNIVARNL